MNPLFSPAISGEGSRLFALHHHLSCPYLFHLLFLLRVLSIGVGDDFLQVLLLGLLPVDALPGFVQLELHQLQLPLQRQQGPVTMSDATILPQYRL